MIKKSKVLISIQVNSNRSENLLRFFDSYEKNAYDPSSFEIIVNIDHNENKLEKIIKKEQKLRKFQLKYIKKYKGGYFDGHKGNNSMLEVIDKNAYFAAAFGDRVLIKTKYWDKILKNYIGMFPDNIFRIKFSEFKYRNYIDYWECCFAPANIFFVSTKWLKITGNWSPCFSHDAFQQCIAYYLFTYNSFNAHQFNRDIAIDSILFSGDSPERKNKEEQYKRIRGQIFAWNVLTSSKMQKESKRRAMLLVAHIIMNKNPEIFSKVTYNRSNILLIKNKKNKTYNISYKINSFKIFWTNFYRKFNYLNYTGGGFGYNSHKTFFNITHYLSHRYKRLKNINDYYNKQGLFFAILEISKEYLFKKNNTLNN